MIVTLEEAIAREEDIVADNERFCAVAPPEITADAYHSATYHRRIAEWLKELAERKTGKWIEVKTRGGKTRTLICPFCKWKSGKYMWESYNYCPYCGAKMEVDE